MSLSLVWTVLHMFEHAVLQDTELRGKHCGFGVST